MINIVWGGMILIGVVVGAINGRLSHLTTAAIDGGKEAVAVCITMLGIVSMWQGFMKIAEDGGIITVLSKKLKPLLRLLFPQVPANHPAMHYIALNFIANMLGLGWAATPAGLKAMAELQKLNRQKDTASNAMCMFLIINMSSVQIISVNLLAFRSQYESANPAEIIMPGVLASTVGTILAILFAKLMERRHR